MSKIAVEKEISSEEIRIAGTLASLSDVHRARMEIWVLCTACGHSHHYHPSTLRGVIERKLNGRDDSLLNAARLFRCSQCLSRNIVLIPYAPGISE